LPDRRFCVGKQAMLAKRVGGAGQSATQQEGAADKLAKQTKKKKCRHHEVTRWQRGNSEGESKSSSII